MSQPSELPGDSRFRLELSREEMRALGYRIIDAIVEHFAGLPAQPVGRRLERSELEARLREPPPERGTAPEELLEQLASTVFHSLMHVDHPRFFAFVPSPGNFVGAMADALAAGLNPFVGTWLAGSGPAALELVSTDWLRQLCGLPEEAGGLFVSGGSMANLTALAVARHAHLGEDAARGVVYFSDQTHSSVERALRVLGFSLGQMQKLRSDDGFRLPLAELRAAVAADRRAGRQPFCVVANAGTTNTGAVDPLRELAEYCRAEGLWLHADGAYGAAAVVCDRGRAVLGGLELVDSLALDPHKWLFQPFEIGCVLVRDRRWLRDTFRIMPEYLEDVERLAGEVHLCDYGVQLTRGFRALKLWLSLKVFGLEAFRQAQERGFRLAELAEAELRRRPGWQIVTPAQMAVVSFRYLPPDGSEDAAERLNTALVGAMMADGFAMLTSTRLRGHTVLRLCTINPRTTDADIAETVARLDRFARELSLQ